MYVRFMGFCPNDPVAVNPCTRVRTYEVRDERDEIIAGSVVTQEYNHVTQGGATSINTTFYGARFADTINAGLQPEFRYYQQFSVQVGGIKATPGFVGHGKRTEWSRLWHPRCSHP